MINNLSKLILALAPMHQVSRADLRLACRKAGADLVFTEMVASEAVIRRVPQAWEMMSFGSAERPIIVQIFGTSPKVMAQAAKMIEQELKPDGIDVNFGCPVQKAQKQGFGAIQLSDPQKSSDIIRAMRQVLKTTQLSCKIRIPDKDINKSIEFVRQLVDAGIDMISVHGRTPTQKYKGESDWTLAFEIKSIFPNIIVLGNGDIKSAEDFEKKIGNLDGVMIGRWAKNHPEIFTEIKQAIREGGPVRSGKSGGSPDREA